MNKHYAGIGARKTPVAVQRLMVKLARHLSSKGYTLRSGHARGADQAFEEGAQGNSEIYLPWDNFEKSNSRLIVKDQKAFDIAQKYHPYWENLSQGARRLQARNCHQVLGLNLEDPSAFVICWTDKGKGEGGTGQALRIAKAYNIPIFDMGKYENIERITKELKKFLKENKVNE